MNQQVASQKGKMLKILHWGFIAMVDTEKVQNTDTTELDESNSRICIYVIMPRLGKNLDKIFKKRNAQFTKEQVCSLGIQLVNILEQVHSAGLVYNDLKLDNLLVDADTDIKDVCKTDDDIFDMINVNLIDFGYITKYQDSTTKEHISKSKVDMFRGNIVFSSVHQLKFDATGRRDDMISLFYLMIYLLCDGQMPGHQKNKTCDSNTLLQHSLKVKMNQTSKDLCFDKSKDLRAFKKEVFSYSFEQMPNYDSLRSILQDIRDKERSLKLGNAFKKLDLA